MNPETPKIVAAWLDCYGYVRCLLSDGRTSGGYQHDVDTRLAESGQRAIWPEGHGVAVIEDIPTPEPLPTAYCWRTFGGDIVWRQHEPTMSQLIATVTFDEDGNAHVERVAS